MGTLTFDTLSFSKALQAGGFTREQAETLATQRHGAFNEMAQARELATKADLRELAAEAELNDLKVSLIKWFVGSILSLAAFLTAVFFGMFAVMVR